MNSTTTLSIVLRHVIPALQAVQRELLDAERVVPSRETPAPHREPAPQGKPLKRFYKLAEAAELLNLSKATLYKMTMTRRIPFYKVGSRTMFSEEQLLTWVKAFEHTPDELSPRRTPRR